MPRKAKTHHSASPTASEQTSQVSTGATSETALPQDWSYEAVVENVEAIVSRLETGELELGEVFKQFEQAVAQLKQCEQFLQSKQEQAGLLIETLEDPDF